MKSLWIGWLAIVPFAVSACTHVSAGKPAGEAATEAKDRAEGVPATTAEAVNQKPPKIVNLKAKWEGADGTVGECGFKVRRLDDGTLKKEFEVELENARPGEVFTVTLDGVTIGELTIKPDGEGELQFSSAKDTFPENFREPQVGSIIKIGDSIEVKLEDYLAKKAESE